jgi:hypothetical protein
MAMKSLRRAGLLLALPLLSGCATLAQLGIQAPQFSVDNSQQPQLRLVGPSFGHPQGGAALRLYARVRNPNPIGLTLARLAGGLQLEGRSAAQVDFPLGVPLQANGDVMVPLDITVNFNDIPGLADVILRAATGQCAGKESCEDASELAATTARSPPSRTSPARHPCDRSGGVDAMKKTSGGASKCGAPPHPFRHPWTSPPPRLSCTHGRRSRAEALPFPVPCPLYPVP